MATRSQTGSVSFPLDEPVRLASWNLARSLKDGKGQAARNVLDKTDTTVFIFQELFEDNYRSIVENGDSADPYIHLYVDADPPGYGLGQAMFVRKVCGGEIANQSALSNKYANGRSVLSWISSDRQQCVVGVHFLSGPGRRSDDIRLDNVDALMKHFQSFTDITIICGDLNMSEFPDNYMYVQGPKHRGGGYLDGCLVAKKSSLDYPRMQSVADGVISGSDHPLCQYGLIWKPRR